jgi:hypothetical protein
MSECKTTNGKAHIFIAMKRRIRHIRARNDEWVHVHRGGGSVGGASDWGWKIGLTVVGLVITVEIIKELSPYLILGLIGWVALKWFKIFK